MRSPARSSSSEQRGALAAIIVTGVVMTALVQRRLCSAAASTAQVISTSAMTMAAARHSDVLLRSLRVQWHGSTHVALAPRHTSGTAAARALTVD
jgi:hypothetical protein